jgi:small multidrug resistance family-3 protein
MPAWKSIVLFVLTAIAEILGCWLPLLWLRQRAAIWILVPAALSLAVFVWLLTLHAAPSGRVYAAYGCAYVSAAMIWLWLVDGVRPDRYDLAGTALALSGMALIALAPRA